MNFFLLCFLLVTFSFAYTPGYELSNFKISPSGFTGDLTLLSPGPYPPSVETLKLVVNFQTQQRLRIQIFDPSKDNWQVPYVSQVNNTNQAPDEMDYDVTYTKNPFSLKVVRTSDDYVLLDTKPIQNQINGLIYQKQYIEWTNNLEANPIVFGLGERRSKFPLDLNQVYTHFAIDINHGFNDNWYGVHPVYYQLNKNNGKFHALFLLNSNPMDVVLNDTSISWRTIGGIIDLFVFTGGTIYETMAQYQEVIGKPYRAAYWHLGWQQCRWGYKNISDVQNVVDNYNKYQIPLDTQWTDIDTMDNYKDFTFNPTTFPKTEFKEFTDSLHAQHKHYIPIIDPGIKIESNYFAYELGNELDIWVKNSAGAPFFGQVWPGYTYFPDFTHPKAKEYWKTLFEQYHKDIGYDSIWIDMNEASNFIEICKDNEHNYPYVPGGRCLNQRTITLESEQYISSAFNTHSMYGYTETIVTREAFNEIFPGKRTAIISRSTFAGQGKHGQHWLGDNYSTFEWMKESIAGIIHFNLFGVPLVGADICGFNGETTEELCVRWSQLGVFYPFTRNHNSVNMRSQEPFAFSEDARNTIKSFIELRYYILPYLYTTFESAARDSMPVWRAMMYDYPEDSYTWYLDEQVMVGDSFLIFPVLEEGATSVEGYVPNDDWYNYLTGESVMKKLENQVHGLHMQFLASIDTMPILLKGGKIIPAQPSALTTYEARQNNFELIVALDSNSEASGWLYVDDGESIEVGDNYSEIHFNVANNKLTSTIKKDKYDPLSSTPLHLLKFFGMGPITSLNVNGKSCQFDYNAKTQVLTVSNLNENLNSDLVVEWD
ncbi:acid alpha glucosidase relate [Anaeramoeba flamelloides]|uniref:Maltase n=1 Tax=Anaeramoeba flamelloides TaxID=1746091 RepID=A0AAV8AEU6_9EUKA|nr:acid alpha glucosidase relate [Anaeramoeba flamelloides]